MGSVANLDDHRPHIRLSTPDGKEHIIPVALVKDMIEGRKPLDLFDEQVWRGVLRSFLWSLENQ